MTDHTSSRREFLGLGALAASGTFAGCLGSEPEDISDLVSTHPAEGVHLSIHSAQWSGRGLFGPPGADVDVGVSARDGGEYWVRMAIVWDGATRSSDTETTTLVPGETAAIGLYRGVGVDLAEIDEILVGAGPVASPENPIAQEAGR